MARNPLDPDAWLREEHRFDMPGEGADIRLGVHATTNFNAALAYAVHKASQQGDLPGGEPNCGIILVLDMFGLERLPEADAVIALKHQDVVIGEIEKDRGIAREMDSVHGLAEAVLDFIEMQRDFLEPEEVIDREDWFEAFWREHVFDLSPWIILNPLERIAEDDPERLFSIIRSAIENREFPIDMWAEAIEQWRFMEPVGFDRLVSVHAVHPVEPDMVDDPYYEDEDEEGPIVFDMMDVGAPYVKLLWSSGEGMPVNAMYHGTDVYRARKAFPEIEELIDCPWDFGQPEGVGPQ